MAGGTFKNSQAKTRPGTYVNLKNGRARTPVASERGVGIIPLIGYDWGLRDELIQLTADSPDAHQAELGRSVYDDNEFMLMVRMMLMGAATVYVYIPDGGTAATKAITVGEATLTATAKYKGTLGNKIQIVSVANPVSGFDVSVYLDGSEVEMFERCATFGDLAGVSEYVEFTGTAATQLAAFASQTLSGGTDATGSSNTGVTAFLDKAEKVRFNTMCFPVTEAALQTALLTKIKYIRETIGWKCQAVAPNFAADYEGIINLVNAFTIEDTDLSVAQACAWLAGATAGADYVTSLTYATVAGATRVVGEMTNEEAVAAIKAGKTFFTIAEDGSVILEYDTNSLVTFTDDKPADANKNRPLRVYDSWCNDLLTTFVPGRYDNDSDGWTVVEGLGRALLAAYEEDGAITNVDAEADFVVDQEKSVGDSMYINSGIQAVDSADKYYITTIAR